MSIGWSDGKSYDSYVDYQLGNERQVEAPVITSSREETEKPEDYTATQSRVKKQMERPNKSEMPVDRDHDVPLLASAIMHPETGEMTGIAVDRNTNVSDEDIKHLQVHEFNELGYMNNLVRAGMDPQEAYHQAHDRVATPTEADSVKAEGAGKGLDPEQYYEDYKARMRQHASEAAAEPPTDRHPDAHTTKYKLDEAELGVDHIGAYTHLAEEGNPMRPVLSPDVLSQGVPSGPGKLTLTKRVSDAPGYKNGTYHTYEVHNEKGLQGYVDFVKTGDVAYLSMAGGARGGSNSLGPSVVRNVFREFVKDNPDVKTLSAERISGARDQAGTTGHLIFEVNGGKLKLVSSPSKSSSPRGWEAAEGGARIESSRQERQLEVNHSKTAIEYTEEPGWQDQPLRSRSGSFMSRRGPLAETGPASFRNALRALDVPTNNLRDPEPEVPPTRPRYLTEDEVKEWQSRGQ